ncbi:unnamed protein product [Penicillium camemberti]|uniref:Str. FM013 n=1 Tax=Penicillium camemberti (strain FM 013) TaxID=1429867 RepID=A0A0G4P509_PENC3|nr:unnamed protein product [Penicillium camemberti]
MEGPSQGETPPKRSGTEVSAATYVRMVWMWAPAEPSQLASEENNADNVVRDPVDPLGLFDELEGPLDWPSEGLFDQETHSFLYLLFKYQTILIEVLAHASFMN